MSIVSTQLVRSLGGTESADGNSTARLLWQVVTDSLQDDHFKVLASPDLPKKSSAYNFYGIKRPGLHLRSFTANLRQPEGSRFLWDVIGDYSSESSQSDNKPDEQTGDPLDMTPKISIYHAKERKAILRDLNNVLIASSAGVDCDSPRSTSDVPFSTKRARVRSTKNALCRV